MSEWKEYKIGDIGTVKGGKRLPKGKMLVAQKTDHPYIRIRDLNQQKVLELNNEFEYVDNDTHKEISRYIVDEGDVLLSIVGTIGLVTIVGKSLDKANLTENCVRITNLKEISSDYLYYYLVSTKGQNEIKKGTVGAVQPKLPIYNIQDITISAPDLDSQRNIASILSSLDDKIAVNKKICENLEAQAQALFKHWFVDFAPFKNGNFVESELGLIPEGWRVGRLGEIAEFKRGKTITKSDVKEGSVPVVAGGLEPAYYHNQSNTSSRVITISGSGANAGFTRMYYQPVWASDCSYVDNDTTSFLQIAYCYLLTNKKKVDALQWGAAQPHVYAKDVNKLPLVIAPLDVLNQFEEKISKMFDLIEVKNKEITRLSTLRDTLLPKLMSGEIKVNDIEL